MRRGSAVGIGYIVLTAGCFATSDATAKYLGASLPIVVLLWSRYVFQSAVMVSLQWHRRGWRRLIRSAHPRLQALRAALLAANATCAFAGLQVLPLAEFTALVMLGPMFSTLLAATLLRERVAPARWAMVLLGFVGMLVIVRPGHGAIGWAAALPIAAAALFAFFQVVTSKLAALDDTVTTNLLSGLGALTILCAVLLAGPIHLFDTLGGARLDEWLLIGGLGAVATLGQMSMTLAIRAAPLSVLTPFGYVQIAMAAAIGWLVFSRAPDGVSALGMALIALAGAATVLLHAREAAVARGVR